MTASTTDDATLPGSGPSTREPAEGWLPPGTPVGRYMVLSRLGAGGMGVVYAAYDPELDRRVALKLLRPSHGVADGSRDRDHHMLKQEAQALAKLAHPNVIAIHDVGEHMGRVFLAMEFVDGETLTAFTARAHGWREVLAAFLSAGEGLAAAHAAGLVHRDFKPDNVMIGKDERVRVMDFGLARRATPAGGRSDARPPLGGGVAGTPAYMAPEQIVGQAVDARSDQFSFCVALWEGLYGARPFVGLDLPSLLEEIEEGRPQPTSRGAVPGWLRRVLTTGLGADPARRYPSMHALLAALRRDPSRARQRMAVAGAITLALGGGWGGMAWNDARIAAACEAEGRAITSDWGPQARAAVERTFTRHDVAFVRESWERVEPRLDAYADRWRAASEQACRAHRVEARWDDALSERAAECLTERRGAFVSVVEVLSTLDLESVLAAHEVLAVLPPVEACLDEAALGRRSPPHPEDHERALDVRVDALRAEIEWEAGRQAEATTRIEAALAEAEALADPELVALAEGVLGRQALDRGEHERGTGLLRQAYLHWGRLANAHGQLVLASALARAEATYLGRLDLAEVWIDHAAMLHQRVSGPDAEEPAILERARASLLAERGDYEGALVLARGALAQTERELGVEHPDVETLTSTVTDIESRRGNYDAARLVALEGLERQRKARGEHHPEVARTLVNLSIVESQRGELEAALRYAEQAVALTMESLGPDHPRTANAVQALAAVQSKQGRNAAAIEGYERALAVYDRHQPTSAEGVRALLGGLLVQNGEHARAVALLERVLEAKRTRLGRDSPDLIPTLINLGAAQRGGNDLEAAARTYREALRVGEASLAHDHPMLAFPLNNLGTIERIQGRLGSARQLLARALEIRLAKLGPRHPLVASTLDALAEIDLDEGDPKTALARLDQAREIMLASGADPLRRAQIELNLARALADDGSDPDRAWALLEGCERALAEPGHESDRASALRLRRRLEAAAPRPTSP
jgi:tetratricopeptide (TPR) repeat protein/predicted Ser/Thr protein kinase